MRFKLSTILWCIALTSVLICWHFNSKVDNDISGVWYYPTVENKIGGFSEILTIRKDKSFTKHIQFRSYSKAYEGYYSISENGIVHFKVKSIRKIDQGNEVVTPSDLWFRCRCATDEQNNLIINDIDRRFNDFDNLLDTEIREVNWYAYTPIPPKKHLTVFAENAFK